MLTSFSNILARAVRAHRRIFVSALVTLAVILWTAAAGLVWFVASIVSGLPDEEALRGAGAMPQATTLLDASDRPIFTIFKEQRIEVPLSRVSPHLVRAIVAVEDQRFFDHGGVDVIRVAGAAWKNIRDGWGTQGGSTITQQLARQSFLTRDKTLRRKLKEVVVAARLEGEFTKGQILQMYLNKVYFGDGLYGVEAASLGYFGRHAADLTLEEAALLAGLVKAPSTYAPTVSLERAMERRSAVLQAMRDAGTIDAATQQTATRAAIQLRDTLRSEEPFGQYFKEEVRKWLVQQFGWERVYQGGLQVYTTLDLEMQKLAETEVRRAVEEIEKRQSRRKAAAGARPEALQAALVALDPATGEVRAMVGGRSFDQSRFNRVTQAHRQPGSAFKPFVYAAALERGYTPASVISALDTPVMTVEGAWVPDDHSSGSSMTMRAALKASSNRAAVRMMQEIGIPAVVGAAERLGLESVPSVPSLALGSGEVTLMSMTAAYAAFANAGMRPVPTLIRRVETTDGEVLYTAGGRAERAISEATAFLMTTMMADVLNGGTAWQARRMGFTLPAAGKTGTTNDYRDAWFVGYTPHLATGVWVGYDQPRTIIGRGYAATLAVPLWGRFMAGATRGDEPEPFKPPRTVVTATVCRLSGKLATESCRDVETADEEGYAARRSMVYTEYFVRGTEPDDYCIGHEYYRSPPGPVAAATPRPPAADVPSVIQAVPIATAGIAGAPVAGTGTAASAELPPPARRPGFWGRLFGRGKPPATPPESGTR